MNTLYDKGRQKFLEGSINWLSDTIKAVIVDTDDYTYVATHEFFSSVPSGARTATATLITKTSTNGVARSGDPLFAAVTGDTSEAVIIYKDTGVEATSPLIAYMDTAIGLPVVPTGDDVVVVWSASGIFKL